MNVKLRPEVKSAWIEALRSGEFAQTTGMLNRVTPWEDKPAGHCCMGVICELAKREGVIGIYSRSAGYPPDRVTEWAYGVDDAQAFDDPSPFWQSAVPPNVTWRMSTSFAQLNDGYRWSFDQIADHLEENDL